MNNRVIDVPVAPQSSDRHVTAVKLYCRVASTTHTECGNGKWLLSSDIPAFGKTDLTNSPYCAKSLTF